MVKPILILRSDRSGARIGWNIDANVGFASPNRLADVQLVQLGYRAIALGNNPQVHPDLKRAAAQVPLGPPCSGRNDDSLVAIIRLHQSLRGGTQDGHVSVIRTDSVNNPIYVDSAGGTQNFMLNSLVNNIRDLAPNIWPRVDLFELAAPLTALRDEILAGCSI